MESKTIFISIISTLGWFVLEKIMYLNIKIPNNINKKFENQKKRNFEFRRMINLMIHLYNTSITVIIFSFIYLKCDFNNLSLNEEYLIELLLIFPMSYFIFDLYFIIKLEYSRDLFFHHIVTFTPIIIILYEKKYHEYLCIFILFAEIAQPFSSIKKILEIYDEFKIIQNVSYIIFIIFFYYYRGIYLFPLFYKCYKNTPLYFSFNLYVESILISDYNLLLVLYNFYKSE